MGMKQSRERQIAEYELAYGLLQSVYRVRRQDVRQAALGHDPTLRPLTLNNAITAIFRNRTRFMTVIDDEGVAWHIRSERATGSEWAEGGEHKQDTGDDVHAAVTQDSALMQAIAEKKREGATWEQIAQDLFEANGKSA